MALITSQQYLESVKKLKPRVYCGGKWAENLLDNPVTKSMVMANAAIYELAQEPEAKEIMVAKSHLTGEPVNRNLNVARNIHDLDMRQEMALLTSQTVGTCNYRCVGCDALNALASTTWEMDRTRARVQRALQQLAQDGSVEGPCRLGRDHRRQGRPQERPTRAGRARRDTCTWSRSATTGSWLEATR